MTKQNKTKGVLIMDRAILSGKPQVITIVKGAYNLTNIVKIKSIESRLNKGLEISHIEEKDNTYKIYISLKIGRA
tara:strand:+ start:121 stop:345 length:225 start_codon:yes stop_codon:yes gene_type:complete